MRYKIFRISIDAMKDVGLFYYQTKIYLYNSKDLYFVHRKNISLYNRNILDLSSYEEELKKMLDVVIQNDFSPALAIWSKTKN